MTNTIVSISGSQGCGKSTTIKNLGITHGYANDSISIPRYVQQSLGYSTLAEVLAQPIEAIKSYQLQILEAKRTRDLFNQKAEAANGVLIVERNFADIYAFAMQWALDSDNEDFVQWVEEDYKPICIEYQAEVGYLSFLLSPLSTFTPDPRRASEESRFDVHERMITFLNDERGFDNKFGANNYMLLGVSNLDVRVKMIDREIQSRVFNNVDFSAMDSFFVQTTAK